MAIYSFSAGVIQRSKGHLATAAAAYRAGELIRDERTGQRFDYSRKKGVLHSEIIAPENAPGWMLDRAALWSAVELQEKRYDAQLGRHMLAALPHELDDAERLELVRGFVAAEFVDRGMVADFSIHAADRDGDERNAHVHIALTMRRIEGDGFAAKKAREWNSDQLLEHWREAWAAHSNAALERAGYDARIDHRTLEAQGLERIPSEHMGKHATAAERKGDRSPRGDRNREIAEDNAQLDRLVEQLEAVKAAIIAREERLLDERYGRPEDLPAERKQLDRNPPAETEQERRDRLLTAAFHDAVRPAIESIEQTGESTPGGGWWEGFKTSLAHYRDTAVDYVNRARETWREWTGGREPDDRDPPDLSR